MKKACVFTLAIVLAFCGIDTAHAENNIGLTVDTVHGSVGDTVCVTIAVDDALRLDSLQFRVNYDAEALKLMQSTATERMTQGGIAVINTETEGLVQFAFACAYGLETNGDILTLEFEILSKSGSMITVSEVLATKVDADLVQYKAYLEIMDGGVQVNEAALPLPVATHWTPETPTPAPTATPQSSQAPNVHTETASQEKISRNQTGIAVLAAMVGTLLIMLVLLIVKKQKRKK